MKPGLKKIALILLLIVVGSLTTVIAGQEPVEPIAMTGFVSYVSPSTYIGLSSYVNSLNGLQSLIYYMNGAISSSTAVQVPSGGLTIHRIPFNPSWRTQNHLSYSASIVQQILSNCPNAAVIVDRNHLWSDGSFDKNADFKSHMSTAIADCIQVCKDFKNEPRVIVELVNEYSISSEYLPVIQPMIDQIRAAGYTNPLLINKYSAYSWDCVTKLTDSANNLYIGTHQYFNSQTASGAEQHMQTVKNVGFTKIINTEVGADSTFASFTSTKMSTLAQYIDWCYRNGIGTCLWTYVEYDYMTKKTSGQSNYENYYYYGLELPA
jgi:hypothetical protein